MKSRSTLIAAAVCALTPLSADAAVREPAVVAALSPIAAGNKLIATPWSGQSRQFEQDTEQAIRDLEGKEVANTGPRKVGSTRFRWSLREWLTNVSADLDIASPPGFRSETPLTRFQFEAPLNGSWSFRTAATLNNRVKVWDKGSPHHPIFSWSPTLHLGVNVTNFKVVAHASLDASDPGRPRLASATLQPKLSVGGSGVLPSSMPITFTVTYDARAGTVTLRGNFSFSLKGAEAVGARLSGSVLIVLRPTPGREATIAEPLLARYQVDAWLRGNLSLDFSADLNGNLPGGNVSVKGETPWNYTGTWRMPALEELALLRTALPVTWGEGNPLGKVAASTPGTPYGSVARALEQAIYPRHLPNGTILAIDRRSDPRDPRAKPKLSYAIEADSAIWTGHYLAAESYRYAATGDGAALDRLKVALSGIERLFSVTQDSAVADGRRVPVTVGKGLFARTTLPSDSPIDYTVDPTNPVSSGPLQSRPCYYEAPEDGWRLLVAGTSRGKFATYASALDAAKGLGKAQIEPIGRIWRGWGCGTNMPLSRDALVGVVTGLGIAFELVREPGVQQRTKKLLEDVLDLLLRDWNLRLPPDNRIVTTSSFLGDFPKQVAFLRIGKTIDPAKYGAAYDEVANAAELSWITEWFDSVDPVTQYFKFNLSHAAMAAALLMEDDTAVRARWKPGYNLLWRAIGHHQNAYFELLHILVQTPSDRAATAADRAPSDPTNRDVTLAKEIKSILGDWITRYNLVKSPAGLPMLALPNPQYQVDLWSQHGIAVYSPVNIGGNFYAAAYPLPPSGRIGAGMEWIWQRSPFAVALRLRDDDQAAPDCAATPPSSQQLAECDAKRVWASREASGDDYLIAYWLARYLGVLGPGD